ncbi:hypothetical protein [Acidithiobacillus thiooxidans]|uniref:hypothetical protein n=1 Tax=Acidithiobacillus thiooxidans TaxID=930 RepID=UPI0004E12DAB|nr:hypothetical protein [Acidithiobacillus thiooxidans]
MNTEDIFAEIENANRAYRSGEPIINDHEYDQKIEALRETHPDHPFLNQVEPEPEGLFSGEKVRHVTPMLSTKKAYSVDEVANYINNVLKAAQDLGISPNEVLFKATPKLDGLSGRYDGAGHLYQNAPQCSACNRVVVQGVVKRRYRPQGDHFGLPACNRV